MCFIWENCYEERVTTGSGLPALPCPDCVLRPTHAHDVRGLSVKSRSKVKEVKCYFCVVPDTVGRGVFGKVFSLYFFSCGTNFRTETFPRVYQMTMMMVVVVVLVVAVVNQLSLDYDLAQW